MDSLKYAIQEIELIEIEIPLIDPFKTSFETETHSQAIIVKLVDTEGNIGWGETAVSKNPGYCYETVKTAWYIQNEYLIPITQNYQQNVDSLKISEIMQSWETVRGHEFAKGGIEAALWALKSEQDNTSLANVYQASKSEIPTGVSIGIQENMQKVIQKVDSFLSQGYHRIKVKIDRGWDVEIVKAIRKEYGDIQLMVDANSAYTLSSKDIETMKSLDKFELTMIEQPLAYNDILQHKKLQSNLITPICLDESIHSIEHAKLALEYECCRIINVKPGRVGGYSNALKIAKDVGPGKVWCGGMLETGIGRIHNICFQANNNFTIPGDTSGSDRYFEDDIIEPGVTVKSNGFVSVPNKRGLGFTVLENRLNDYKQQSININLL